MISRKRAREIASEWHSGQSSPLYAFASSGTLLPGIRNEVNECLQFSGLYHDIQSLKALLRYVDAHFQEEEEESK